jgi:hypothetical protein
MTIVAILDPGMWGFPLQGPSLVSVEKTVVRGYSRQSPVPEHMQTQTLTNEACIDRAVLRSRVHCHGTESSLSPLVRVRGY